MAAHALLGPSGASRWLACPPSARSESYYPNEDNLAAAEGTLAHDISDVMVNQHFGFITVQKAKHDFEKLQNRPWTDNEQKVHYLYSPEMLVHCKNYLGFIVEIFSRALAIDPKAVILIEQNVDLTRWIPEGFGRTDITIIAGHTLFVIDFKYGQGVRVEAVGNKQMRMYALGSLDKFKDKFPGLQTVEMHIYQPRLKNFGVDVISAYELWNWAEEVVRPIAQKAFLGLGDYAAGDHCKFCRAKPRCRTLSEYARTPAGSKDFADPNTMTDEEIAEIGRTNPLLVSYSKDVAEYMLRKALTGYKWPLFKLVEGRSNRKILDDRAAIVKLTQAGFKEVYNISIKPFGELDSMIGADNLKDLLGGLLTKPEGKPTLVREDDSRDSYHTAASDFKPIV